MMGMKRCLAGLLAGVMLFPGIAAVAEETDSTVKIQESLVSREETEDTSLRERLFQIAELMNTEPGLPLCSSARRSDEHRGSPGSAEY